MYTGLRGNSAVGEPRSDWPDLSKRVKSQAQQWWRCPKIRFSKCSNTTVSNVVLTPLCLVHIFAHILT